MECNPFFRPGRPVRTAGRSKPLTGMVGRSTLGCRTFRPNRHLAPMPFRPGSHAPAPNGRSQMSSAVDIPEPERVLRALGADDDILTAFGASLATAPPGTVA